MSDQDISRLEIEKQNLERSFEQKHNEACELAKRAEQLRAQAYAEVQLAAELDLKIRIARGAS